MPLINLQNLAIWVFVGVNNNILSIIASQYFLLCKQSKIAFMYDCQIDGDIFNPIGFLWYKYEVLPKYGKIPQYHLEFSESIKEWNASFKSNIDKTSHLQLPYTENVSFNNGKAKLFLAVLMFRCLKSVMTLLPLVTFLLINITWLE